MWSRHIKMLIYSPRPLSHLCKHERALWKHQRKPTARELNTTRSLDGGGAFQWVTTPKILYTTSIDGFSWHFMLHILLLLPAEVCGFCSHCCGSKLFSIFVAQLEDQNVLANLSRMMALSDLPQESSSGACCRSTRWAIDLASTVKQVDPCFSH